MMSRNRFEIIMRMLHLANNEVEEEMSVNSDDCGKLFKVKPLIDKLEKQFLEVYEPG